jgi:hypothetical protein
MILPFKIPHIEIALQNSFMTNYAKNKFANVKSNFSHSIFQSKLLLCSCFANELRDDLRDDLV